MFVSTGLEAIRRDAQQKHAEVVDLLETEYDLTNSESSYSTKKSLSTLECSSGSLSLLPGSPKIFHGRESELRDLIDILLGDSPRVAILGTGGMGKTTLAKAALHHPTVTNKYQNRYFIPCDSALTSSDLVSITASNLGIDPSRRLANVIVRHLLSGPPSLLVLDNLETAWEPVAGRPQVEEFLSLLTDVPYLALLVTMRGAERPANVRWTRPFLPPLPPLPHLAARQTFIDIADDCHDDSEVDELLELTDNLPLAVCLVANVAGSEGCTTTIARWKIESTALLSEGYDKRSNLEVSIMLSRMRSSHCTQDLLDLLSLLPDGVLEVDLLQSNVPVPNILRCKATLVRTSLAYLDATGRVKVLAPIREYIQRTRPPSAFLVRPLRQHFNSLLDLWTNFLTVPSLAADLVPRLAANTGNLHNLLLHGLDSDHVDLGTTIRSVISLNHMNRVLGHCLTPLMLRLPDVLDQVGDHRLHGLYIAELFQSWQFYPITDPDSFISQGIEHLKIANDVELEARFYNVIAEYNIDRVGDMQKALEFHGRALSLATESGDTVSQCRTLDGMARSQWFLGNYQESQKRARETQVLAAANGNLIGEAAAMRTDALCCTALGDFIGSARIHANARELITAAGLQDGDVHHMLMNSEADVLLLKTQYADARLTLLAIISKTSPTRSPVTHAHALLNLASVDTATGMDVLTVRSNLDAAMAVFGAASYPRGITACELYYADLSLREDDTAAALSAYARIFAALRECDDELACHCLTKLADTDAQWAVVFVAFALRAPGRNMLAAHHALRCLGEACAELGADDDTALSVFGAALEGYTQMDVHRSRGECMLHMGDIYARREECAQAKELWTAARALFDCSQQARNVVEIDKRLRGLPEVNIQRPPKHPQRPF
ncbi:hypothetical protein B0H10DRAFT_1115979 [Mycena sp. CBHHK59/15]|nr:hypothetical protein B0H10DRAFT_1115979 [Mycena sp. CBHHK59/15]